VSSNPTPVLAIIILYTALYSVIAPAFAQDAPNKYGLDSNHLGTSTPSGGLWDAITGLLGAVWGFVTTIFDALTFNVPGVPPYIQYPIAALLVTSLSWSIVSLIRGKGD